MLSMAFRFWHPYECTDASCETILPVASSWDYDTSANWVIQSQGLSGDCATDDAGGYSTITHGTATSSPVKRPIQPLPSTPTSAMVEPDQTALTPTTRPAPFHISWGASPAPRPMPAAVMHRWRWWWRWWWRRWRRCAEAVDLLQEAEPVRLTRELQRTLHIEPRIRVAKESPSTPSNDATHDSTSKTSLSVWSSLISIGVSKRSSTSEA